MEKIQFIISGSKNTITDQFDREWGYVKYNYNGAIKIRLYIPNYDWSSDETNACLRQEQFSKIENFVSCFEKDAEGAYWEKSPYILMQRTGVTDGMIPTYKFGETIFSTDESINIENQLKNRANEIANQIVHLLSGIVAPDNRSFIERSTASASDFIF